MYDFIIADGLFSEETLEHYGVPQRSGRYPWGSGENPYHHGASAPGGRRRKAEGSKKQLTAKQKRSLKIGAAAVGTALAVAGSIYLAKSGKLSALYGIGKQAVSTVLEKAKGSKLSEAKREAKKVMAEAAREADRETSRMIKDVRSDRKAASKARMLLSDADLTSRINRLEKEKKLKDLTIDNLNPRKKEIDETLVSSAKKILGVSTAATGVVGVEYLIRRYLKDEMTKEELSKAIKENMRPKKK